MNVRWNDREQVTDAYSTKIYLLCKKFLEEGHEIAYYGVEGNNCPCTENIPYLPYEVWNRSHGVTRTAEDWHEFGNNLESYQYAEEHFLQPILDNFNERNNEVILSTFGLWSEKLRSLPQPTIEWGIGYDHPWSTYRAYESYAWQHIQYAKLGKDYDIIGPKWYDAMIPGYADKDQFRFEKNKQDYLLFIGRIMDTKGINIAIQLAEKYQTRLVVAGNGETGLLKDKPYVEYVGCADLDEKRELFANAKATLCMSQYVEPFGNVHVESLMSGTPVITTDFGVYSETVPHGMVGYRGRVWEDHCYAIENIHKIDPQVCRDWAEANFSMEAVYPKFNAFFKKCAAIESDGEHPWYHMINDNEYTNRFHDYHLAYKNFIKNTGDNNGL
jgi:glycosyltransferase involved in cell wall biosynthesis